MFRPYPGQEHLCSCVGAGSGRFMLLSGAFVEFATFEMRLYGKIGWFDGSLLAALLRGQRWGMRGETTMLQKRLLAARTARRVRSW